MRKLDLSGDIADSVDVIDVRSAVIVNVDEGAFHPDPALLEADTLCQSTPADTDDAACAFGGLDGTVKLIAYSDGIAAFDPDDFGVVDYCDLLLF